MTLIGMLHHRRDPNKVRRAYAFAAVAKAEGLDLFYFTPGKVDFDNKTILGKVLKDGNWLDETFPFPDVIYNSSNAVNSRTQEIIHHLMDFVPFTSHSIGNKMSVYENISEAKTFAPYQIPTYPLDKVSDFLTLIDNYNKVVIKPVWGHKGNGVAFIEKKDNSYLYIEKDITSSLNLGQLRELLQKKIEAERHLLQPYIKSKTKDGNSFDFRIHVQKNGLGHWVLTSIYPRIAENDKVVTNLSGGGYTAVIDLFLKNEFGDRYFDIYQYLKHFGLSLASHLDEIYHESFDELGIDVGLDNNQRLWIFEVNWRPGTPPTMYLELDVVRNTLAYAKYLAESYSKKPSSKESSS